MNIKMFILSLFLGFWAVHGSAQVKVGATRIDEILRWTQGKRVGITTNHTGILDTPTGHIHIIDTLLSHKVDIHAIFTPEHGLRGNYDAGAIVHSGRDPKTNIRLYSLYTKDKKPTPTQLKGLDLMIFDIQDVGVRFYTYISTLFYVMEACAEQGIPLLVLDRPNPHDTIDGAVRKDDKLRSFVSLLPLPVLHGLTLGEAAMMICGEGWLATNRPLSLHVVTVLGWKHGQPYSLPVPPSPNLKSDKAIRLYPTIGYLEASSWSEGRGTSSPFEQVGYPDRRCGTHTFIPMSMSGATAPKHKGKKCHGPHIDSSEEFRGIDLDLLLSLIHTSHKYGIKFITKPRLFDLLAGDRLLRRQVTSGVSASEIRKTWQKDLDHYKVMRAKYLLYDDY